jgi:formylglycine-generating enzyme required for sulfatase activity
LELSWDQDAASADGSVPSLGQDGAVTTEASSPVETPPSCQAGGPGMTNCGAASESCCTSLDVPGGTYYRTYDNDGSGPTNETDPATVSGFRLDRYLVTVGRFRQFVNAIDGGWLPPAGSGKHTHLNGGLGLVNVGTSPDVGTVYETGWVTSDNSRIELGWTEGAGQTWTPSPGAKEALPINSVTWYEAYAFCIWDGGFLPSESEWEYAAAGGSQQREYPWGSTDPGTGNQYAIYGCNYPSGSPGYDGSAIVGICDSNEPDTIPDSRNIAPVGLATLGAGYWGQLDMAGDVPEWSLDLMATYVNPCIDCANMSLGTSRVTRGGAYYSTPDFLHSANRVGDGSPNWDVQGFRCARTP